MGRSSRSLLAAGQIRDAVTACLNTVNFCMKRGLTPIAQGVDASGAWVMVDQRGGVDRLKKNGAEIDRRFSNENGPQVQWGYASHDCKIVWIEPEQEQTT